MQIGLHLDEALTFQDLILLDLILISLDETYLGKDLNLDMELTTLGGTDLTMALTASK